MPPPRKEKLTTRRLLAFGLTTCFAVWVGGSVMTDVVMIPIAFRVLPREQAIIFGAEAFRQLNIIESMLGAATVLMTFAFGRPGFGTRRRSIVALCLNLAMTLCALIFLLYLTPYITARAEALVHAGVDLDDLTFMPPDRVKLRDIHIVYALLDGLKISAGVALLWLLSTRRSR